MICTSDFFFTSRTSNFAESRDPRGEGGVGGEGRSWLSIPCFSEGRDLIFGWSVRCASVGIGGLESSENCF